ncbi:MAG TPA: ATP-binding protein [Polyangiaceae bacterium]|nr:ATP-binding protein [Polyangiaceae bacterium]
MSTADPELSRLLVMELERHLEALEAVPLDPTAAQRAVHALTGSAGLAGEGELASTLERVHRRIRDGDDSAYDDAAAIVRTAARRLSAGETALAARWPIPPDDLVARPLDPLVHAQYAAEVRDRLTSVDEALADHDDPVEAARTAYRHVHTMKGAASAVGDEPMSWFCHGLEERLKTATTPEKGRAAIQLLSEWRSVLGGLLDEPETALGTLRRPNRPSQPPRPSIPSVPLSTESDPPRTKPPDGSGATIRVAAADADRLLERLDVVDQAREAIGARAERAHELGTGLRELRGTIVDALRLIGPPRPWGAPAAALARLEAAVAALGDLREELETASLRLSATEQVLRDGVADAKRQLSTMRQTTVGRLFGRLTTAVESEARRTGRAVIVRTRGADEKIDRRIAEQLVEPCLQLVRNAVAHGIEAPETRAANGKPHGGTISLGAGRVGNRLSVTIEDDGAGVDVADVRARALAAGLVTPAIAEGADDDTLLSLLFLPGFSTRESSDLLAGRGIGLEIARSGIQRMHGVIRLSSRAGEGFSARIDVPVETGLVRVLWVTARQDEFALPAVNARRVRRNNGPDAARVPHLLACLEGGAPAVAEYAVDLDLQRDEMSEVPVSIGVDAVGRTEEVLVRPLGPLVSGLGPFAGAIVRGHDSLRLAIDVWAVAPRARAFAVAAQPGHLTTPPASRRP